MAQTVTNVTAAKPAAAGAVYRAPYGTTLPTDATTSLAAAFVPLGYCSEDGLKNNNTPETSTVKAWGGDTVLTFQTGKEDTFDFTLLEALSVEVLKTIYGEANVTGTLASGITVNATAAEATEYVWVFDMIERNAVHRIVLPDAKVTAVGEITYDDDAAVGYAITLTAMPDATGKTHIEYLKSTSST